VIDYEAPSLAALWSLRIKAGRREASLDEFDCDRRAAAELPAVKGVPRRPMEV
jgi:hypothetical protein